MQYYIKRGSDVIATVKPTGQQSKKIMGENIVTMNIDLPGPADFQINDYVDVFVDDNIERYFLFDLADVKKASSKEFNYTVTFKGWQYYLDNAGYLFPDADNAYTLSGQSLMGTLDTFVDLLIANANRDQTGWVKGTVDTTDYRNLTFNTDDSCLSVLATLAAEFNVEWWIDGQTIHLTNRGDIELFSLQYGRGNGLYNISRTTSTNKKMVTRLYPYGGEKNIPADYKGFSNRLKLPGSIPFLEKNVYIGDDSANGVLYGVIERTVTFDDVYPHRTGIVTTVTDQFNFIDSAIDFDLNVVKLAGITAHLTFNTGQLAGYTFEINSFNNATQSFKINPNQDDKAFIVPTALIKPAVGDEYVITDIAMPSGYIDDAEAELQERAQAYLDANCNPIVSYQVDCDPLDFKRKNTILKLGNYVPVQDDDLGLDANLRITSFTRDLQVTWLFKPELSETVAVSPVVQRAVANENLKKNVTNIGKTTNSAYNNALQAKATADGVKAITDYWGVTIDAPHGLIASGTLLVGAGPVGNAGITGVIDNVVSGVDKSVRFWAGADYAHKDTAPFRVNNEGKMIATAGFIGNWSIDTVGLVNDSTRDVYLKTIKRNGSGAVIAQAYIGTDGSSGLDAAVAVFQAVDTTSSINIALHCKAAGATISTGNIAAYLEGGLSIKDGFIEISVASTLYTGITQDVEYNRGSDTWVLHFVNGIYVGNNIKP
ncbi:phage tail protein [Mucilaginibacter sp.]|uniref:phage tail protein n=1 Tax=Mucilaginibacter sp. TaxID=1882438 RepID=UPI0025E8E3E1|nr:phage tail protein [Mucilaginibacter sp.]